MSRSLSFIRLALVSLGYWLVWSVLHVLVLRQFDFSWQLSIADSFINNAILAGCCYAIITTLKWYQPRRGNAIILIIWISALAKVCVLLSQLALDHFLKNDPTYGVFLEKSLLVRFAVAFLTISFVTLARWIYNTLKEKEQDISKKSDAEKLAREAELTGLRQQLQPHFLFNSLNSISALAGSRPEEARKMIQQLSDFLRGTLRRDDQKMASLREELSHLQLYLDIEKVRFGHRLNTVINTEEASLDLELPPLLLQPIVENAIKFGLYDTVGEIEITINTRSENKNLVISITNPFDPETAQPKGTGFGLSSVQRRLYLMYSRGDLLQTSTTKNLFTTLVKIPQSK